MSNLSLLLALCPTASQEPPALEGLWAGAYPQPSETVSVELSVRADEGGNLAAELSLPERGLRFGAQLRVERERVRWWIPSDDGGYLARFEGAFSGEALVGTLEGSDIATAECSLVRVVPSQPLRLTQLVGTYALEGGGELRLLALPRPNGEALAIDYPGEGLQAVLYPVSPRELWAGEGELSWPRRARLRLDGAPGEATGFELEVGEERLRARRVGAPATEERAWPRLAPDLGLERREVPIPSGDVLLAGTLTFPPGATRPVPAVVQLHGSAPTRRQDQWTFYTSICLRAGLAVLAYDKRGCGQSGGTFEGFTVEGSAALFDRLASDAAAAHAWLRTQEGIDPQRVGLIGGSQAGWIMPLVAEKTEAVRFIVSGAGPTVSAGEEDQHARWLEAGLSPSEADRRLATYEGPRGFDPRAHLRRAKTPTLWLFGGRDTVIPTGPSLDELERVRAEGHTLHAVHVFPEADHNFRTPDGGVLLEPILERWLADSGVLP